MDLPNFDEVLKMASKKPDYLKQKERTFEAIVGEKSDIYKDIIKKPKCNEELMNKATISKEAQINKQAISSIKDADQNFKNYLDYLALNKISEESGSKEEKEEFLDNQVKKVSNEEIKKEGVTKVIQKKNWVESNKKKNSVKDKEKEKRMKGQSSHSSWKSETFMKLRQQFD